MNKIIISQLNGLLTKFNQCWKDFEYKDNEYAVFNLEYHNYYHPIITFILPSLNSHLNKNPQESFSDYEPFFLPKYIALIKEELTKEKRKENEFLKKLSHDITNDFNVLLVSYGKTEDKLRLHFLNQFIKNRKKAMSILLSHDPELALKTIAKLKSPKMQFYFLNKLSEEITDEFTTFMGQFSWEKICILLDQYCFYPNDIEPKDYYALWQGEQFIHVKFCKIILGKHYNPAKDFLKTKFIFNQK